MDYYLEARRIARLLRQEGLLAEAGAVEEAIDGGATATEILMGIRFALERAAPKVSDTTAVQISSLMSELDAVLS